MPQDSSRLHCVAEQWEGRSSTSVGIRARINQAADDLLLVTVDGSGYAQELRYATFHVCEAADELARRWPPPAAPTRKNRAEIKPCLGK